MTTDIAISDSQTILPPLDDIRLSVEQWTAKGLELAADHRNLMWHIAEWMQVGVERFGDQAENIALKTFRRSAIQIKKAMDVAARFPPEMRRAELSFGHHQTVMPIKDDSEANRILDEAVASKMTVNATKKAVNIVRESRGGDVYRVMKNVNADQMADDWYVKMTRLWNRCPNGVEGRDMFLEQAKEADGGLIDD